MNLEDLLQNKNFVKNLDESLKIILKDNKIDEFDIPEIIYLITYTINTQPKLNINNKNLGKIIKELFNYLINKKVETKSTEEQLINFNKLIDSSIKLFLLKPNYNKLNNCINKILYCK